MFDIDTRVRYVGSLGDLTGTVTEHRDPIMIVNIDGMGLLACAESELEPLDDEHQDHVEPAQQEQPPVLPEPELAD